MAEAGFKAGAKIERWRKALENPERALKQIGTLMVAESQEAFREQRFDGKAWAQRGPINIFGIIADFAAGKTKPPARRFQRTPVLIDTGRLQNTIAYQLKGTTSVEVGSDLPYASIHQTGGPIESETIADRVQRLMRRWLDGPGSEYRERLSFLLTQRMNGRKLQGEVEPRPFIGITRQTVEDVAEVVGVAIFEVT